MVCYSPIPAWYDPRDGVKELIFSYTPKLCHSPNPDLHVPCQVCIGCRLEYSRQWAVRGMAEAHCWRKNCFITLTYNPEFVPKNGSLVLSDFQKFMKRLRKRCMGDLEIRHPKFGNPDFPNVPELVKPIRTYYCGEYGDFSNRPHYHAILFNFDFPDKVLFKKSDEYDLYTSEILTSLWSDPSTGCSLGFASVGECNFDTIAYVARYMVKKVKGRALDELNTYTIYPSASNGLTAPVNVDMLPYQRYDSESGEVFDITPEFSNCSRAWGIGKQYFDKYNSEIYVTDSVVYNGRVCPPPRYFDKLLQLQDEHIYDDIKRERVNNAKLNLDNNSSERLNVRKRVKEASISSLKRVL